LGAQNEVGNRRWTVTPASSIRTDRTKPSSVIGWSSYDGTGRTKPTTGDSDEPPYETGVAALIDGWRLFQAAQLIPPYPGHEHEVSFLKHEFLFERLTPTGG